jgi:hypothetical protein
MNLNQFSSSSAAVMAVVGALRSRRADYADAVMKRPGNGVTTRFIESAMDEKRRHRLADLAVLLDLIEHLECEIKAEVGVGARGRLKGKLLGLQAVAKADPEDVLGRIRFGRHGQWFPTPQPVTEARLFKRARGAVNKRRLPPQILELVFRPTASAPVSASQPLVTGVPGAGVHREAAAM